MQDPQPRLLISGCARVFLQDPDPIQLCNELPPSDTPAQLSFRPPAQTQIAYLKDIRTCIQQYNKDDTTERQYKLLLEQ